MVRDFFLFEASWFKDATGNWGFGFGFTVDPLPFNTMSGFPYSENESYPNDTAHQNYLQQWNTRVIGPSAEQSSSPTQNGFAAPALTCAVLTAVAVCVMFKSSAHRFLLQRGKRVTLHVVIAGNC
jgi:hypothetical protein